MAAMCDNAINGRVPPPDVDRCSYADKYKGLTRPTCGCLACREFFIGKQEDHIRELEAENARLRKEQGKLTKQVRDARHQIRVLLNNGRAMIEAAQEKADE